MTPETWGFWEWASAFVLFCIALWVLVEISYAIEQWVTEHRPGKCELCRREPRRPGDVLCWTCTRLIRRGAS